VITAVPRSDTVHAIRDSELVRIPAALFDAISARHPATTVQFMRLIAGRVRRAMGEAATAGRQGMSEAPTTDVNLSKLHYHYMRVELMWSIETVCILGASRNVPVAQFAGKLKNSLEDLGASTAYLDQGTVIRHLGRHAFSRIG
jgi:lysophospholipid hydrolase